MCGDGAKRTPALLSYAWYRAAFSNSPVHSTCAVARLVIRAGEIDLTLIFYGRKKRFFILPSPSSQTSHASCDKMAGMQQRKTPRSFIALLLRETSFLQPLFLLIVVCTITPATSSTRTTSTVTSIVAPQPQKNFNYTHRDYSFFHGDKRTTAIRIDEIVQDFQTFFKFSHRNNLSRECYNLDVSNSNLEDSGIVPLLHRMLQYPNNFTDIFNNETTVSISLEARMNNLTPQGFTRLLETILQTPSLSEPTVTANATQDNHMNLSSILLTEHYLNNNTDTMASNRSSPFVYLESIDVGLNAICPEDKSTSKKIFQLLRQLIQSSIHCPETIRLDQCGVSVGICRAIGKGMINHYSEYSNNNTIKHSLKNLFLSGNKGIGDAGVAALAAALRMVGSTSSTERCILDVLDLSSCGVGDAGAEALALAIADSNCGGLIQHLDLSNNDISDHGLTLIGKAILSSKSPGAVRSICVDNNKQICNPDTIASCFGRHLTFVSLRSCSVRPNGVMAFARAIRQISFLSEETPPVIHLDLSGNEFGIYKPASKKKKKSAYENLISSQAATTTAAYFNTLSQRFSTTFKEATGLDVGRPFQAAEKDDISDDNDDPLESETHARILAKAPHCGARSFADQFVNSDTKSFSSTNSSCTSQNGTMPRFVVGMRHCSLDKGAADALAAAIQCAKQVFGLDLMFDVSMNPNIDNELSNTLLFNNSESQELRTEMANRYLDTMEALKRYREREEELKLAAAKREKAEAAFADVWRTASGNMNSDDDEQVYGFDNEDRGGYDLAEEDDEGYIFDDEDEKGYDIDEGNGEGYDDDYDRS